LLRDLRTDAGMTVEDVAEVLLFSASKVSRMETGTGLPGSGTSGICAIRTAWTDSEREHLTSLAEGQKEHAWWWQPCDLPLTLTNLCRRRSRGGTRLRLPGALVLSPASSRLRTAPVQCSVAEAKEDLIFLNARAHAHAYTTLAQVLQSDRSNCSGST
jgi:hypothetical protein